mmetsp:Transcript_10724/g.37521  ORF Transcript_10724/g.37521 Transcript_10724/m.37521 type:complete len:575 (-) Transcript_10724:236-1960(-)
MCRRVDALDKFVKKAELYNDKLLKNNFDITLEWEILAARLYHGPMYEKYNTQLRGESHEKFLMQKRDKLLLGTSYVTTIHGINGCVVKLSKLTAVCEVFRGMVDAKLADVFWQPNDVGFCGGVEFGFMSAMLDRNQALRYAQGAASTLFEMKQGMAGRGADMSWLNQYGHEREILFPPLMGIHVLSSRVCGRALIIEARLELTPQTLEQVQRIKDLVSPVELAACEVALRGANCVSGKPTKLVSGQPKAAAMGLYHFMRVKDPFVDNSASSLVEEITGFVNKLKEQAKAATLLAQASEEERAVIERFVADAYGEKEDIDFFREVSGSKSDASPDDVVKKVESELLDNLKYVLYEPASEVYVEGQNSWRDAGRGPVTLEDFMAHENVEAAELTKPHVAALRLYTTLAFKYLNAPLRDQTHYYDQRKPHPLPKTVALVNEGIKKMRAAHATKIDSGTAEPQTTLWRGLKNREMSEDFMLVDANGKYKGGTELAPMSTTTEFAVAAKYSHSDKSLLFKVVLDNFMQYGAEVKWLSAFPQEEEVLYPPLTYLQPTGRTQHLILNGSKYKIVEVKPTLP